MNCSTSTLPTPDRLSFRAAPLFRTRLRSPTQPARTITLADLTGINNGNNRNSIIINAGTFILNGGNGAADLVGIELEDAGGTINVQSGTLSDEFNAYFQNATFDVAAGAAFALDPITPTNGSDNFFFSGTSRGSGAGNLLFNSGGISPGDADGTQATSSVLNFPAGFAQVTGSAFVVNPQEGAVQQVTNAGFLDYVGAAAHANLGMFNQGTINVIGSGDVGVSSQRSFHQRPNRHS